MPFALFVFWSVIVSALVTLAQDLVSQASPTVIIVSSLRDANGFALEISPQSLDEERDNGLYAFADFGSQMFLLQIATSNQFGVLFSQVPTSFLQETNPSIKFVSSATNNNNNNEGSSSASNGNASYGGDNRRLSVSLPFSLRNDACVRLAGTQTVSCPDRVKGSVPLLPSTSSPSQGGSLAASVRCPATTAAATITGTAPLFSATSFAIKGDKESGNAYVELCPQIPADRPLLQAARISKIHFVKNSQQQQNVQQRQQDRTSIRSRLRRNLLQSLHSLADENSVSRMDNFPDASVEKRNLDRTTSREFATEAIVYSVTDLSFKNAFVEVGEYLGSSIGLPQEAVNFIYTCIRAWYSEQPEAFSFTSNKKRNGADTNDVQNGSDNNNNNNSNNDDSGGLPPFFSLNLYEGAELCGLDTSKIPDLVLTVEGACSIESWQSWCSTNWTISSSSFLPTSPSTGCPVLAVRTTPYIELGLPVFREHEILMSSRHDESLFSLLQLNGINLGATNRTFWYIPKEQEQIVPATAPSIPAFKLCMDGCAKQIFICTISCGAMSLGNSMFNPQDSESSPFPPIILPGQGSNNNNNNNDGSIGDGSSINDSDGDDGSGGKNKKSVMTAGIIASIAVASSAVAVVIGATVAVRIWKRRTQRSEEGTAMQTREPQWRGGGISTGATGAVIVAAAAAGREETSEEGTTNSIQAATRRLAEMQSPSIASSIIVTPQPSFSTTTAIPPAV